METPGQLIAAFFTACAVSILWAAIIRVAISIPKTHADSKGIYFAHSGESDAPKIAPIPTPQYRSNPRNPVEAMDTERYPS